MPIPDFVQRLRAQVGTDLLWLPGVSAVVFDDQDRILLARRSDNGKWGVISGIAEPGEEPAATAVREVAEETGVVAEVVALTSLGVSSLVRYSNGDQAQYLDICFWCRAVGGHARVADDESTDVSWYPANQLPAPLLGSSVTRLGHVWDFVTATRRGEHPQPWFSR